MGVLFGTDGVRGVANKKLTAKLAYKLGMAGAYVLGREGRRPLIAIGKDTRISGDMLEAALAAGILSVGGDCLRVGVIPTPGLAYLTRSYGCCAGIVISASHNPVADNGIKFFAADGYKLPDSVEEEIENLVLTDFAFPQPIGGDIGRVFDETATPEKYLTFLKEELNVDLSGLNIVLDCANGAASKIAPRLFADLGAAITVLHGEPNGININENCGSTHTGELQQDVKSRRADLGLAFDGDADRLIAVDEQGNLVDGDRIMVICGLYRKEKGMLDGNKVTVTVMSNMGLKEAFDKAGIIVQETKVGDRYIMEEMRRNGGVLGGEQSGHIIFLDRATTGDGLVTALELLRVVQETGQPLSRLSAQMRSFPQTMVNVRVENKEELNTNRDVAKAIRFAEEQLQGQGRILGGVAPRGTEPLVRVMGEALDEQKLKEVVKKLAEVVAEKLGCGLVKS
ncbi:phosphoglucosamine mutase [Syntrophaceticus schinkii]|uniref:Phosphoglucosamine mutase n=1 Tax=Syntrophaceticus schinkii TaxID=499207 RepID=A0A0B7MNU3_9FIRM|nr:phosphoglucosamine mutase [Syntrophaceticus schinkii]CEO89918.1 phosphoglucosamine mutase [Syntrophaceticus schinkii]